MLIAAIALAAPDAVAQQVDTLPSARPELSPYVAREAVARYNDTAALRVKEPTTIPRSQTVEGNVAALEAAVTIAGTVRGDVIAINAPVILLHGARVDGGIFVVGGIVSGLDSATVSGEVRTYQSPLRYIADGQHAIHVEGDAEPLFSWSGLRKRAERENGFRFRNYATYNRVEGLPIYAGPYITRHFARGTLTAELFGVIRSADNFSWTSENLGHRATIEARSNGQLQFLVGGRLQDIVEPIQGWQISNSVSALATFFLHRDFRDWYGRQGGTVFAGVAGPRGASLIASLSDEQWASRMQRDPWTLFRDAQPWRENPAIDDGRYHSFRLTGTIDTRNDPDDPRDGWTAFVELERGNGVVDRLGERSRPLPAVGANIREQSLRPAYTRGLIDVRRYSRLSPETQLNARVVTGGWLGGDPLPLQRQLSVGGFGTLPGYDFNDGTAGRDKLRCTGPIVQPGRPAECDRIALAQLEYRVDLGLDRMRQAVPFWYGRGAIVAFVDAGRGWRVRDDVIDAVDFGTRTLPALNTFMTDVGAGVDFSLFGVYVAKAVSASGEPPNVFVRIRHRF
jgi:hypothetical protein